MLAASFHVRMPREILSKTIFSDIETPDSRDKTVSDDIIRNPQGFFAPRA
jgi:hypothetical protein